MIVRSREELISEWQNKMSIIIENVAQKLVDELLKIIEETVYSYEGSFTDNRTREFKNSWEYSKPIIQGKLVSSEIFQNFLTMTAVPELFIHGSEYNNGELVINELNEIINNGLVGKKTIANFPQIEARPFWDEFQKYLDKNFEQIFMKECMNQGLTITQNNTGYYGFR